MNRTHLSLLLFFMSFFSFGQVAFDDVLQDQLPAGVNFKGNFLCCVKWTDKLGLNYLITSETNIVKSKTAIEAIKTSKIEHITDRGDRIDTIYDNIRTESKDKDIWAVHYIYDKDSAKVLWEIHDYQHECYGGIRMLFLQKPVITDLNNNDTCQTWIIYKLCCSSDVSPMDIKLIMHIGHKKYAVRGRAQLKLNGRIGSEEGTKTFDYDFKKLPKPMIDYANKLWAKYKYDEW